MSRMGRKAVPILQIIRPGTARRLWSRLAETYDGCLVFTGTKNRSGYGLIDVTYASKTVRFPILAHRLAWVLANGCEIPEDRIICHRCNNPSCCNPKHLYLGTPATNAADMVRAGHQARLKPLLGRKGEAHPMSKHTDAQREQAIEMRRRGRSFKEIARAIRCTPATACRWWNDSLK